MLSARKKTLYFLLHQSIQATFRVLFLAHMIFSVIGVFLVIPEHVPTSTRVFLSMAVGAFVIVGSSFGQPLREAVREATILEIYDDKASAGLFQGLLQFSISFATYISAIWSWIAAFLVCCLFASQQSFSALSELWKWYFSQNVMLSLPIAFLVFLISYSPYMIFSKGAINHGI